MKTSFLPFLSLLAVCLLGPAAPTFGQLFEQDFSSDSTASWTVNNPMLSDILVDFFYDYSLIGVPTAPNGTGTRGLKMTANNSGGVFSGFSVSPTGENFTGKYQVAFDLWQNYAGPLGAGGSGTAQLSFCGIGTAGNVATWAGSNPIDSISFAVTLDGGSASDYRAYSSAAPTSYPSGNPVYASSSLNGSDAYYSGFGGESAPPAQPLIYPGQTGTTDPGEPAFRWRRVLIEVDGTKADWSIDGLLIASVPFDGLTLGGGNILFGHSDTNAGSSSDPNDTLLNVTLIDNILVSRIFDRPVVTVKGPKARTTTKVKARVQGTVTGDPNQLLYTLRNASGVRKRAMKLGSTGWTANVPLEPGLNRISFSAKGPGGISRPKTIRIRRL